MAGIKNFAIVTPFFAFRPSFFFSLLISEIPMFRQFSFYSIVHSFSLSLFFFLILSTLIRINADVLSTRYRRQITPSPTSLHIPSFDDRTDRATHITIVPSSSYRERG